MMPDIGISNIVPMIVASTSDYIGVFAPVFYLVGGIVLAGAVIGAILDHFFPQVRDRERRDEDEDD